jgi:hypothetical protein
MIGVFPILSIATSNALRLLLLAGLLTAVVRRDANLGKSIERSDTNVEEECMDWSMSGKGSISYKQKSTASLSESRLRYLHATISQAVALVSLILGSSSSRVEKCHLSVL